VRRVLFISHSSELLGGERSLLDLLRSIDRDLLTPIVIIPREGPLRVRLQEIGIKTLVVRLPTWSYFRGLGAYHAITTLLSVAVYTFPSIIKITRIIRRERIDLVYTNCLVTYSGAVAALIARKRHVWHAREILGDQSGFVLLLPKKSLLKIVSRLSARIIANSRATAGQFDRTANTEISVIYNGVSLPESNRTEPPASTTTPDDEPWPIAVIGGLNVRKGQDDAIRAVKIAMTDIAGIRLLVVGAGDRRFSDYLVNLANDLRISKEVEFTGYRQYISDILADVRAVVVPSRSEPFGRVAIEAMAAGVPVVASDVGGLKEIVVDGFNGYLVPRNNPEAIAEKLVYLYENQQVLADLGDNAREWAHTRFSMERYVREIQAVILSLVA
jgi:glycosyltransferase involved in cell wall biosynthesis